MTRVPENREGLVPALRAVSDALGSFALPHSGGEARRRALRSLVDGYLLPRLADPDGALVVAVVGGSGSGKSTLINSLAQHRISPVGPRRPTTTAPLVWSGEGLPATLGGLTGGRSEPLIVSEPAPPPGLVLVDMPPPSVSGEEGGAGGPAILAVADACLFVASGIRYADAAGWELIDLAVRRRLPSLYILNRLSGSPEVRQLLQRDFARRLIARGALPGQGTDGVVGVDEGPILPDRGGLAPEWVTAVRTRLEALADPPARREVVRAVVSAALASLDQGLADLRGGLVDEAVVWLALADPMEEAYRRAAAELQADLLAGRLALLAEGPGERLAGDLAVVAVRRCSRAARAAASAWDAHPAGRRLLTGRADLWGHGAVVGESARQRIGEWEQGLPARAAQACGKTRLRRRRARREAEALRRASLDQAYRLREASVRRPAALAAAAQETRRQLGEVLGSVLTDDAVRFRECLGAPPAGVLLARLRLDREEP